MWSEDPGFVKYDYKNVQALPKEYHHQFDYVVIDPPFVTDTVWEKYAQAAKLLLIEEDWHKTTLTEADPEKEEVQSQQPGDSSCINTYPKGRFLLSTVAEHDWLLRQLLGASICKFRPCIPTLIYQYSFFVNYNSTRLDNYNPEIDPVPDQKRDSSKPYYFAWVYFV